VNKRYKNIISGKVWTVTDKWDCVNPITGDPVPTYRLYNEGRFKYVTEETLKLRYEEVQSDSN
jgi:hypothetical protein